MDSIALTHRKIQTGCGGGGSNVAASGAAGAIPSPSATNQEATTHTRTKSASGQ